MGEHLGHAKSDGGRALTCRTVGEAAEPVRRALSIKPRFVCQIV
jgi:hypothetical protein